MIQICEVALFRRNYGDVVVRGQTTPWFYFGTGARPLYTSGSREKAISHADPAPSVCFAMNCKA
jgi:hypothetical protein